MGQHCRAEASFWHIHPGDKLKRLFADNQNVIAQREALVGM